jgi:hypothetical protein
MRRILLSLVSIALVTLPAAASAATARQVPHGFLVVRNAADDGGVGGHAVVTVVVQGFVLGRATQEAKVDVYQLPSTAGEGAPQAHGPDVTSRGVRWRRFEGHEYSGSGFRFRAIGGTYRVVVWGSGIYLFAGGRGSVWLHGSSIDRGGDGSYSLNGAAFRSLPAGVRKLAIGRG